MLNIVLKKRLVLNTVSKTSVVMNTVLNRVFKTSVMINTVLNNMLKTSFMMNTVLKTVWSEQDGPYISLLNNVFNTLLSSHLTQFS